MPAVMLIFDTELATSKQPNMSKKYTLLILALAGMSIGMKAQTQYVNVLYQDNSNHAMSKSEIDKIEIGQGFVTVVPKSGTPAKHRMSDIAKIVLDDRNITDGITAVNGNTLSIKADGNSIRISGATADANIEIYDAAGRIVGRATCNEGNGTVNVGNYPTGTYIIKTDGTTRKFIKR